MLGITCHPWLTTTTQEQHDVGITAHAGYDADSAHRSKRSKEEANAVAEEAGNITDRLVSDGNIAI